ncbi:MAG: NAD/NADP octopine/nopaline dehydrogenase family protein [Thermomicrobiales bacterium]|nr:NAD/NADP octopine/nopaline dehydrogenase family protein [Thermomicrobiales bacterium]
MSCITVLGGGNTAFSIAAKLALEGHEILIWEHPAFAHTIDPIRGSLAIALHHPAGTRLAQVAGVTTDAAEALAWSDLLLCSVPSYAHAPFAEQLVPHLRSGHMLALLPGNLGSLAFADAIAERGVSGVVVCESDTAPYVCRKTAPGEATIWGEVTGLGIGVFPQSQTSEIVPELAGLFPGAVPHAHVLAAGLSAMNPVVHPPGVLLNAGRVEKSRGDFYFYDEGVTPSVVRVIEALDAERLAIGAAFGLELTPVDEAFHVAGFGPAGDLWSVINGSRMLTALRAPGSLDTRWLTEDVPYGLLPWSELARIVSVATPVIDALITLTGALTGHDFRAESRTLDSLGLANATRDSILDALN